MHDRATVHEAVGMEVQRDIFRDSFTMSQAAVGELEKALEGKCAELHTVQIGYQTVSGRLAQCITKRICLERDDESLRWWLWAIGIYAAAVTVWLAWLVTK